MTFFSEKPKHNGAVYITNVTLLLYRLTVTKVKILIILSLFIRMYSEELILARILSQIEAQL